MKKIIMLLVVAALAISVPFLGQAAEDTNNCVSQATPYPSHTGSGAVNQNLAPVDSSGWVWGVQTGQAAGRAGAKGSHGWVQASGDLLTQKGRVEGRNTDTGLSGYLIIDGANSKLCVSAPPTLGKTKPLG